MEVAPGVHRIEGVNGSNAVLLAGEQMALVDTGIAGNGDAIVSYIKEIGRSPRDLEWILVTHFHFDHSGSAREVKELTDAKVVAHTAETESGSDGTRMLIKGNEGEQPPFWYRWVNGWGRGANRRQQRQVEFHDTVVDQTVDEGDVIPALGGIEIIHSPGHTPGSVSPLLKTETGRVLFLGDSVLNNVDRLSRPLMWDRSKRRKLDASLRALRELDADVAMFGHGPPLTEEVMNAVRGLTDRPYDLPTWRIALKNYQTLRRWRKRVQQPGHWEGGAAPTPKQEA